ncbi:hypothetical protein [Flagellimonas abyssi]|uniref:Uncharacterized protein n=1 Tax=Flagellimonas abyssi TaxID=2864871 RepID=A0ABS7ETI8_9FLAO|nr:hypothetical protein [Allomuricauda abyssi]MBW8200761.1 hypothetical protein [Allomuricauda abyssi]|tara:strand:- start:696 stop:887 length:192 start_codon:yes stop_codon:yes gene_type:complete
MKNALLLLAVTFMAYPMMANTAMENPAPPQDCHAFACQVAEHGASQGGDVNEFYEMAYEMCNE